MYQRYRTASSGLSSLWIIIGVCFVVFVASTINPDMIISLFALVPAQFAQRPWTLITCLFVHADLGHILGNMFTLYFFGSFLMSLVGENKFLIVYFGGGIIGGLVYLLLPASLFTPVVGASGAIFAVGGALAVLRPKQQVFVFPIPAPIPLWIAVIGGFLLVSLLPFVAWQAHLGGIAFGLMMGYFFRRQERRPIYGRY